MISPICSTLKKDTNELIYKTKSDRRRQTWGWQGEGEVGEGQSGNLELADANSHMTLSKLWEMGKTEESGMLPSMGL